MPRSISFEIIPVIDLLGGLVVRGVKGERQNYQPVKAVFSESSEPLVMAKNYRDLFNFTSIYIADLDRITRKGNHLNTVKSIKKLFPDPGQVYCDPGVRKSSELDQLSGHVDNLVVGTETLISLQLIRDAIDKFGTDKVTLSIDIKNGRVLSRADEIAGLKPENTVDKLLASGIKRVFIIILDAVGSLEGVATEEYLSLQRKGLAVYLGGGVRDINNIRKIYNQGYSGCLIASSLYNGNITPLDIGNFG